ncbi:MAG: DNA-3-methyladenine glycosylase [Chloroflexota bacterium]
MREGELLPRDFYRRHPALVARDLLGMELLFAGPAGLVGGLIVETEAYHGRLDAASHAYRGRTERNAVMFGPPGHAYIYFTYGMHHCLNAVTGEEDEAAAVLIRSLEPSRGRDLMQLARGRGAAADRSPRDLTNGPGKLCQALGLTREQNGLDLTAPPLAIARASQPSGGAAAPVPDSTVVVTTRIGITRDVALPWRFYVRGSPFVSVRDRRAEAL